MGVGTVSPQAQRLIDVTEQSFFAALQVAREGYRVSDIGQMCIRDSKKPAPPIGQIRPCLAAPIFPLGATLIALSGSV